MIRLFCQRRSKVVQGGRTYYEVVLSNQDSQGKAVDSSITSGSFSFTYEGEAPEYDAGDFVFVDIGLDAQEGDAQAPAGGIAQPVVAQPATLGTIGGQAQPAGRQAVRQPGTTAPGEQV